MNLLGKGTDPEFWKEVRTKDCFKRYRDELEAIYKANYFENGDIPSPKYREYKLFWTTGDRAIFEHTYFRRRRFLNASALLSLVYPENEQYIEDVMNTIFSICDEYSWCLPAHQGKLEVNNNCVVDLFASETGETLSEIYTLLGDRLEPLIKARIEAEVDRRIFKPFLASTRVNWWERGTNNWTAVCMGSVGCAFMLLRPDLVDDKLLERFDESIQTFLSGFSKEGMCLEGCSYWHYGFGFFTVFADMVKTFTNGKYDYFKRDDVRNISMFIQKMFLSGRASVSFADGGRTLSYHIGIVHRLKDEYPDDILVYSPEHSYNYDNCARWCLHLRAATWLKEEYYYNPAENAASEYFAPDAQWFVKRNANYGFAAKGGHNAEHHNHNDVGTFIFAKNGDQIIMDLGPGKYCRQYFSGERYTFVETSSRGHNVPIIDGVLQFTGKEASSKNTSYENGVFSTDIAGAYKADGLNSIKRSFGFTDKTVTMKDVFDYDGKGKLTERLVSYHSPEIDGNAVKIKDGTVKFNPDICKAYITTEPNSSGYTVYMINFDLNPDVKEFEITIE